MALPPPGFPKIRGQACGADWSEPTVVTGHLPGTGFGSQFKHTVQPVSNNRGVVLAIGDDRDEQIQLRDKILDTIANRRQQLVAWVPHYLALTLKESDSIEWLLDHSEAELEAANDVWEKWSERQGGRWPLDMGDNIADYGGGVCSMAQRGKMIRVGGNRGYNTLCPSRSEINERPHDRLVIGQRFSDALAHLYCAEYGYWRLSLYKRAYNEYKDLPTAGVGGITTPQEPGVVIPGLQPTGLGLAGKEPIDPCEDLGLDCPPGEDPEGCPSGFCPDLGEFPDPGEVPEADIPEGEGDPLVPDIPVPPAPGGARRAAPYIVSGLVALGVTGVAYSVMR